MNDQPAAYGGGLGLLLYQKRREAISPPLRQRLPATLLVLLPALRR